MVMDAQPSPQNVGREFVRQYYTLLNKAPDFLHRFYNSSSSFVHGGLDAKSQDATLVVGQKQIQNKIQQLNFRDCHAKISQVDSQATLGNGVVVQVTGELSNDGQPMRRFTQTFVLASQSPKKYYVHNDIFRYQDVYTDDELDEACDRANGGTDEDGLHPLGADGSDPAALVVGETQLGSGTGTTANATTGLVGVGVHGHPTQPGQQAVLGSQTAPQALYYPSNVISSTGTGLLPGVNTYGAPPSGAQTQQASQQQSAHLPSSQQQPSPTDQLMNGLHESLLKNVATSESVTAAAVAAVLLSSSTDPQGLKAKMDQTPMGVPAHLLPGQQQQPHQSQLNQTQPPTTTNQLGLAQSQQLPLQPGQQQHHQQQNRHQLSTLNDGESGSLNLTDPTGTAVAAAGGVDDRGSLGNGGMSQPRSQQQRSMRSNGTSSNTMGGGLRQQDNRPSSYARQNYNDSDDRRQGASSQFGDNHQLFLGNIPHHATEEELKALFSKFGTVVDLRIMSKSVQKMPGVRTPPHYGFITYEDPASVQNCLANM
uniref:NTF2 domain-containing protein n=1 Tax=Anopheles maculatus TaxID=74869 RepID=A0A182SPT7_9DIPT